MKNKLYAVIMERTVGGIISKITEYVHAVNMNEARAIIEIKLPGWRCWAIWKTEEDMLENANRIRERLINGNPIGCRPFR